MFGYRRTLYIGMIMIALGIVFTTTLSEKVGSVGIVFIAIGGLLFIVGMTRKKREDADKGERNE